MWILRWVKKKWRIMTLNLKKENLIACVDEANYLLYHWKFFFNYIFFLLLTQKKKEKEKEKRMNMLYSVFYKVFGIFNYYY